MTFKQGSIWEIKRAIFTLFTNLKMNFLPKGHKNGILKQILRDTESETGKTEILTGPEVFNPVFPTLTILGSASQGQRQGSRLAESPPNSLEPE